MTRRMAWGLLVAALWSGTASAKPLPRSSPWHWENPRPQGNPLYAIAGDDAKVCAVGGAGVVVCSEDGGKNWSASRPTQVTLRGVTKSGGTFVAVGDEGVILRMEDRTARWTSVRSPEAPGALNAIVAVRGRFVAVGDGGTVVTSDDGGRRWRRADAAARADFRAVAADGDALLVVGTGGAVLQSLDRGHHWHALRSPSGVDLNGVESRGQEIALAGEQSLFLSRDGGSTWWVPDDWRTPNLVAVARSPRGDFIVAGRDRRVGRLARDQPVGSPEWIHIPASNVYSDAIHAVWLNDDGRVILVGEGGLALLSDDSGTHWSVRTTLIQGIHEDLRKAGTDSRGNVYVVGDGGTVLIYDAAESTWRKSIPWIDDEDGRSPLRTDLGAVWGSPYGHVFISGGRGWDLFRSGNRGQSWQPMPDVPDDVSGLWGSATEMISVGRGIARSTDLGGSWSMVRARDLEWDHGLLGVWGRDTGEYFAVGLKGTILHSADRGLTWERMESGVETDLRAVGGDNRDTWAVGEAGVILRLRAGADRWSRVASGIGATLMSVSVVSALELVVGVDRGGILESSDRGLTWRLADSGTVNAIFDVIAVGGRQWAFGEMGTILLRDGSGSVSSLKQLK